MFTALVVGTLALGIGANTATFSVLKAIALNPLPYRNPERLVTIAEADSHTTNPQDSAYATMWEWRMRSHSFARICMWGDYALRPLRDGHADFLRGEAVNYDFFDMLGIGMLLGRTFTAEDDRPETADTLILSYGLWMSYFGGDPAVLGRSVPMANGDRFRVIGVLPANFHPIHMSNPGEIPQFFVPLGFGADERQCHSCRGRRVIAELKPGVTVAQARAELNGIMRQLVREYPNDYARDASVLLMPLRENLLGRFDTALMILFGAVGLLLLLACSNVANLLLARATGRQAEMALRASLGAGRGRLAWQMLAESLVLSLMGGLVGVGCAFAVTRWIGHVGASEIPRVDEIGPDGWMLLWGAAVSVFTGLLFGMAPAWEAVRIDLRSVLQGATNSSLPRAKHRVLNTLVAAEIALAFVLVLGVGLLGKSYGKLMAVDPGYDPRNVLTLSMLPQRAKVPTSEKVVAEYDSVVRHMKEIRGVEEAGYASTLPLSHPQTGRLYVREQGVRPKAEAAQINTYVVSPGYLRAMKIQLMRGRLIDERDARGSAAVALVSESCAREQFGGADAIGQHVRLGDDGGVWAEVVGIVGDVHQYGLDKAADPAAYFAYTQVADAQGYASLVVRSRVDLARIEPAVRAALYAADPDLPVFHLQPMDAYTAKSLARRTFALGLSSVFGVIALLLATLGIYGVVSYTVGLRTREVGIRMAIGAGKGDVYRLILRDVLMTAVVGLAAGLVMALWAGRLIENLLFGVAATDGVTIAGVAGLICGVALVAGFLPARRAAGIEPVQALRDS